MVQLDCLQRPLEELVGVVEELSPQNFEMIVSYVEKEEMAKATEEIQKNLFEGNFDIRLIAYYLYAHFLEHGIKSFIKTLPIFQVLIESYGEVLRPFKRKEKHIENSFNWFFSHILHKFKYLEKTSKEGKSHVLLEKANRLSEVEFEELMMVTDNFRLFFYDKWSDSPVKERVMHFVKKIGDFRPLPVPIAATEAPALEEKPAPEPSLPTEGGLLAYDPMLVLIKKLKTFEQLVGKKAYLKAALVSQDISHLIDDFDPCTYFPQLFSQYFALLARHIPSLSEQWKGSESMQWKVLEKLYRSDIDRFVEWEP